MTFRCCGINEHLCPTLWPCLPLQDLRVSSEELRGHHAKVTEVYLSAATAAYRQAGIGDGHDTSREGEIESSELGRALP